MYDTQALKQRLVIIKHSSLADATILDENYMQLIKDTPNPEEQRQFIVLRTRVKDRIQKLLNQL
jgi:hypothetical protein